MYVVRGDYGSDAFVQRSVRAGILRQITVGVYLRIDTCVI